MRQIGTLQNPTHAKNFQDYLLVNGIDSQVELDKNNHYAIWILNDDQIEDATKKLENFNQNKTAQKYIKSSQNASKRRKTAQIKQKQRENNYIDARTQLNSNKPKPTPLTAILIALSILFFVAMKGYDTSRDGQGDYNFKTDKLLYQSLLRTVELEGPTQVTDQILSKPMPTTDDKETWQIYIQAELTNIELEMEKLVLATDQALFDDYSQIPFYDIKQGQAWRLITPIFIHYGIIHILFNMLWLKDLGKTLEYKFGSFWLLGFIIATALISNTAQYLTHFIQISTTQINYWAVVPIRFGGMSGVVYALFGYCMIASKYRRNLGIHVPQQLTFFMLGWLFLCLTGAFGNIANAAHFAGIISGGIIAYIPLFWQKLQSKK